MRGDRETEVALRRVGIYRHRVPVHMIRAGAQRLERDAHGIAADPRFALIDASAARVGHGDRAERWLEALGEPDREVVRRGRDRCADRRVGMIEMSVGTSGGGH